MKYWVVGGKYENTKFFEIKKDFELEKYGPYDSYEKAKNKWYENSWKHVDDCYVRYTIISND
ncbi:MAG: hypothetical protein CMM91_09445 [Rickettsiales bacterium]|nr:hypothetical protein [Rickettsiales bacterium]OUV53259.1 MAG: hypothetical protein CBC87_05160 [Rickettsiales bacterium TMED127]|tara:strand:+ start:32164 stop:32349 length:186 start_codon:yes stop_codon:yes gene_type:complete